MERQDIRVSWFRVAGSLLRRDGIDLQRQINGPSPLVPPNIFSQFYSTDDASMLALLIRLWNASEETCFVLLFLNSQTREADMIGKTQGGFAFVESVCFAHRGTNL